jgi:hypothetical protein
MPNLRRQNRFAVVIDADDNGSSPSGRESAPAGQS